MRKYFAFRIFLLTNSDLIEAKITVSFLFAFIGRRIYRNILNNFNILYFAMTGISKV